MATISTVRGEQRRTAILAAIRRDGSGQIDLLAADLGVSEMTVRRDLDDLETEGFLRRVRGGAVAVAGLRQFGERRSVRTRAKQAIAAKAADLLPHSGAIALDASSTVGTLASAVRTRPGIVVATNSYENFSALRSIDEITAALIGGEQDPATGSFVGRIACDAAQSMLYQAFFTSAYAVHATHGTSEASLAESQVKRAFAAQSKRTVLCIDSSKLDDVAVAATLSLEDIDILITELDPADARLDAYRVHLEIL
ncbi:DeoR/GlpR family DNA-binding transcription regulator [Microbacterium sp. A82]|uniref:DeoR/GlpR family DNA-binding transcription regulator n=1 Tax=Microbacterium sp. A82 TaxID=3450452 RepID=UPI003F2ACA61